MVAATATTTTPPSSMLATKRQELLALDTRKKSLLSESEAIVSELTAQQVNGVSCVEIFLSWGCALEFYLQ